MDWSMLDNSKVGVNFPRDCNQLGIIDIGHHNPLIIAKGKTTRLFSMLTVAGLPDSEIRIPINISGIVPMIVIKIINDHVAIDKLKLFTKIPTKQIPMDEIKLSNKKIKIRDK